MGISDRDLRILSQKSGNRCAFPGCGELLTIVAGHSGIETEISVSDVAHIIARSPEGPRGDEPLPQERRDDLDNLLLLCKKHHRLIDESPTIYPAEKLRCMKADHERLVEQSTARIVSKPTPDLTPMVVEPLHSTLLAVERLPGSVYSAPTTASERGVQERIIAPGDKSLMFPYIVRAGRLYCFSNLSRQDNPFAASIDSADVKQEDALLWWRDEVHLRYYQELLNRSLNKLTGRKGLMLDKEHHRYYFLPDRDETGAAIPKKVPYTPINAQSSERSVAWPPLSKKTGLPRPYWYHLAVSLKFHIVAHCSWVLSVRPELWVTKDGFTAFPAKKIGAKITSKMSRSFNIDLLEDVQFWRSFLSDDLPRIIFPFGPGQQIIVSSSTMQQTIAWPGLPEEFKRKFKNVDFDDDLFSLADRQSLDEDYGEDLDEEDYEDAE